MKKLKSILRISMILALIVLTVVGCSSNSTKVTPSDLNNDNSSTDGGSDSGTSPVQTTANWTGTTFDGDYSVGQIPLNDYLQGFTDSSGMLSCSRIEGGILKFDTSITGGSPHFDSPTTLNLDKVTVIVKAKLGDGASGAAVVDFDLYNGTNRQRVQLNSSGKIQLSGETLERPSVDFTTWHTYMISYNKTTAGIETKVYLDGSSEPIAAGVSTDAATVNYLRIGDGSGSTNYVGEIDWLYYTTDGAFTPDNVVLPTGITLR